MTVLCWGLVLAQPFTTGPTQHTTQPTPGQRATGTIPHTTGTPGVATTGPGSWTTGVPGSQTTPGTPGTTGVPGVATTGPTQGTTGVTPGFTTGANSFTTGAIPTGTGGFGGFGPAVAPRFIRSDGVWVGNVFIMTPDAPPPPPEEERTAWWGGIQQRLAGLQGRLETLRAAVFQSRAAQRDVWTAQVAALEAQRAQWAASVDNARSVLPTSFLSMKQQWDAGLAELDAQATALEQDVAAQR